MIQSFNKFNSYKMHHLFIEVQRSRLRCRALPYYVMPILVKSCEVTKCCFMHLLVFPAAFNMLSKFQTGREKYVSLHGAVRSKDDLGTIAELASATRLSMRTFRLLYIRVN